MKLFHPHAIQKITINNHMSGIKVDSYIWQYRSSPDVLPERPTGKVPTPVVYARRASSLLRGDRTAGYLLACTSRIGAHRRVPNYCRPLVAWKLPATSTRVWTIGYSASLVQRILDKIYPTCDSATWSNTRQLSGDWKLPTLEYLQIFTYIKCALISRKCLKTFVRFVKFWITI